MKNQRVSDGKPRQDTVENRGDGDNFGDSDEWSSDGHVWKMVDVLVKPPMSNCSILQCVRCGIKFFDYYEGDEDAAPCPGRATAFYRHAEK